MYSRVRHREHLEFKQQDQNIVKQLNKYLMHTIEGTNPFFVQKHYPLNYS